MFTKLICGLLVVSLVGLEMIKASEPNQIEDEIFDNQKSLMMNTSPVRTDDEEMRRRLFDLSNNVHLPIWLFGSVKSIPRFISMGYRRNQRMSNEGKDDSQLSDLSRRINYQLAKSQDGIRFRRGNINNNEIENSGGNFPNDDNSQDSNRQNDIKKFDAYNLMRLKQKLYRSSDEAKSSDGIRF